MIIPVDKASVKVNIFNVQNVHTLALNIENRQENAPYAFGRQGLLTDSMGKSSCRVLRGLKRCLREFKCQRTGVNTCMRTSSDRNEYTSKMADR